MLLFHPAIFIQPTESVKVFRYLFYDVVNRLEALADELYSADFIVHNDAEPAATIGREGVKRFVRNALEHRSSNTWARRMTLAIAGGRRRPTSRPAAPSPRMDSAAGGSQHQAIEIAAQGRSAGRPPAWTRPQASMADYLTDVLENTPDMQLTIRELLAEGDQAASRLTMSGTSASTGQPVRLMIIQMWRFVGSQIAELWQITIPAQRVS